MVLLKYFNFKAVFRTKWRVITLLVWMGSTKLSPSSWAIVPSLPATTSPTRTSTCTRCCAPTISWPLEFWTSTQTWLHSWEDLRSCQTYLPISSQTSKTNIDSSKTCSWTYRVCHGFRLMIIFESVLTTCKSSVVFRGSWYSSVNWVESEIKPP